MIIFESILAAIGASFQNNGPPKDDDCDEDD